jgi:hypothetical protein
MCCTELIINRLQAAGLLGFRVNYYLYEIEQHC